MMGNWGGPETKEPRWRELVHWQRRLAEIRWMLLLTFGQKVTTLEWNSKAEAGKEGEAMLRGILGFATEPVSTRDWRRCGCFRHLKFGQTIADTLTKFKKKFAGKHWIDNKQATYLEKFWPTIVKLTKKRHVDCRLGNKQRTRCRRGRNRHSWGRSNWWSMIEVGRNSRRRCRRKQ